MIPKILTIMCLVLISLSFASAITIKDVSSLPTETAPGEVVSVVLEIENTFNYYITNLNVKLDLTQAPFAPHQSSSEKFLEKPISLKEIIPNLLIMLLPFIGGIVLLVIDFSWFL